MPCCASHAGRACTPIAVVLTSPAVPDLHHGLGRAAVPTEPSKTTVATVVASHAVPTMFDVLAAQLHQPRPLSQALRPTLPLPPKTGNSHLRVFLSACRDMILQILSVLRRRLFLVFYSHQLLIILKLHFLKDHQFNCRCGALRNAY